MKFSFTRFKDRISSVTNAASRKLGAAPRPVQVVGYGFLRGLLWGLYYWPRSHMKKTASALSAATGTMTPHEIYRGFANGLTRTALRMERISQGRTSEIDALFRMPEKERFETLLQENGGLLMVMPHCHGSLLTVRGLAARYPTLMLIREPKNDARAEAQRRFFAHLGCEVLDVRRASEAQVARGVLKALRRGMIVIGTVDRIRKPPPAEAPVSKTSDNVRVSVFGQPVGIAGWPTRFAAKAGVPILPVICQQTEEALTLHVGEPIAPAGIQQTTQEWASALERFFHRFPGDWIFAYDKHWSRVLNSQTSETRLSTNVHGAIKSVDVPLP